MKYMKWVFAAFGIVVVEVVLLKYNVPPWVDVMVIMMGAVIALLVYVLRLVLQDRESERRHSHESHRQAIQVLGVLSYRQQQVIDKLLDQGAEVRQLKSGGYGLVKRDGTYAPLTNEQADYALNQYD